MTEEKTPRYGFRIKWADREVEYYGESVHEVFEEVFGHVKSIPIASAISTPSPEGQEGEHKTPPSEIHKILVEGTEYDRIGRDSGIPKEQIVKVIEFKTAPKYDTLVPFLPKHPKEDEAALLVSYAFQVGLQQGTVDVSFLKRVLKDPNGYLLPSRGLGDILKQLRRKNYLIASQAKKGRNKPFTLSEDGLTAARKLLKT